MNKIIINLIAHDGITSLYTGVGRIVYDSIRVLDGSKYTVNAITGKYNESCLGFNKIIKEETKNILNKTGGDLYECNNGSDGSVSYGNLENWAVASSSTAEILAKITAANPEATCINLCLDTPFAHVAIYANTFNLKNNIFIWIPHSTVLIHKVDSALKKVDGYLEKRLTWEREAIAYANNNKNNFVGYVGEFMKQHLLEDYAVHLDKLTPFINGLNIEDKRFTTPMTQADIEKILIKHNIPTDKKLLLSFGRLEPYKGFEFTIKIGGQLSNQNIQTVLLSQPYQTDDPNISEYQELMKQYNPEGIFLYDYGFDLPHAIIQWHKTHILLTPSVAEPFGLIPEEARLYKNNTMRIICSENGGFPEQISNLVDGFLINLDELETANKLIEEISNLSDDKVTEINKLGYQRAITQYNLKINLEKSLNILLNTK